MNNNLNSFIQEIKTKCSDIYNFYEKNKIYLFSGRKNRKEIFFKIGHISNRDPVNTPKEISSLIDNAFFNNGFQALRSNSIFCTGNFDIAKTYGEVYIVYPKNGFDFTWSRYFDDLYFFVDKLESTALKKTKDEDESNVFIFKHFGNKTKKYQMKYNDEDYVYVAISELIEKLNLKYKYYDNIKDFVLDYPYVFNTIYHSSSDLKIINDWIKKYAKVKTNNQDYKKIMLNYLNKSIPIYYQNDDLISAIKSKHEIMIRADEYYFIRYDHIL